MTEDIQYRLVLSDLYVAPSGVIDSANLLIQTTDALIEEGGVINLSERGAEMKTGPGLFSIISDDLFVKGTSTINTEMLTKKIHKDIMRGYYMISCRFHMSIYLLMYVMGYGLR